MYLGVYNTEEIKITVIVNGIIYLVVFLNMKLNCHLGTKNKFTPLTLHLIAISNVGGIELKKRVFCIVSS